MRFFGASTLLLIFACGFAFTLAPESRAGWGGGSCGPVGPAVSRPQRRDLTPYWCQDHDDHDCYGRFIDRVQVGTYYLLDDVYWQLAADGTFKKMALAEKDKPSDVLFKKKCACGPECTCGKHCKCAKTEKQCQLKCTCAKPKPATPVKVEDGKLNFGMDWKPDPGTAVQDRYLIYGPESPNGTEISQEQAEKVIGRPHRPRPQPDPPEPPGPRPSPGPRPGPDNGIPDDTARLRLTVIGGTEADRKHITDDLAGAPALAYWHDQLVIQSYPADEWAVARYGFATAGQPTIYVQAPDGTVLHHQDDYTDGAPGLAEAMRRADPNYRPDRDPDRRRPDPAPGPAPAPDGSSSTIMGIPTPLFVLGCGVVLLLVISRKKS